jgi:hypothetical protein
MPCDPPNDAVARPNRRSLLGDVVVVFGLMPLYVALYPFIWTRNLVLLRRWRRETADVVRGRWQLEGDGLRICIGGEENVLAWSSIRRVQWTEHTLSRRFIGADVSEFLVRVEVHEGGSQSLLLRGIGAEHPVFRRLLVEGKLQESPRRGGEEQTRFTTAVFAIGSAVAWLVVVLLGLWLRGHG